MLKVGDEVITKRKEGGAREFDGLKGRVVLVGAGHLSIDLLPGQSKCGTHYFSSDNWDFISNNQGEAMDLVKLFKGLFLEEPEKTYRELAITDDSGLITADGQKLLETFLLSQGGLENAFYKEIAKPMLEKKKEPEKK